MKISVVIPLYNKRDTIKRALNSVFAQTVLPEEIIIVNDGSTDGSELVVTDLKLSLITLINQPNQGVSSARNRGIEEAKSNWVAFLDADDIWLPGFLKTVVDLIEKYPKCCVAATSYLLEDTTGKRKNNRLRKLTFRGDHGILDNYFMVASCSSPPIHSSAVAIKKEAIKSVGGFPDGVSSGEDLLTWARLASSYSIAYSTEPLSVFTQDPAHMYLTRPNRIPQIPDIVGQNLALLTRSSGRIKGLKRYIGHWHKMRASIYLRLGMKCRSLSEILISLSYFPLNFRVLLYGIFLVMPTSTVNLVFRRLSEK